MDMFLGAVIVALVGLAIAPFFIMAGSFGKKTPRKQDGSDGGGGDSGSGGGGDGGGGGGGE